MGEVIPFPDRRARCRINGHTWAYTGEELGQYPDGTPSTYEVYECSICGKVSYEPVPD